jgi:hypothetical protein
MSALLLSIFVAVADEYEAATLNEPAPVGVAEEIRKELAPAGIRISDAKKQPLADLWLRKTAPVGEPSTEDGVLFGALQQGGLVGAIRFHQPARDFRDQGYAAGLYTCRYALQPQDGDHLGSAATRDFLVLAPADADVKLDPMEFKALAKLSSKVSKSKHPAVLYLVQRPAPGRQVPGVVRDAEADTWMLECELPRASGKPLRLWIVFVGKVAQ